MTFASSGSGSSDHLTAELFWQETRTKGVHVPYKGGAPAITDLLGGQVDASFQNINAIIQHVAGGKLRALGHHLREAFAPAAGRAYARRIGGARAWTSIPGRRWRRPRACRRTSRASCTPPSSSALNDAQVKEKFISVGFEMVANTPEQFAAFQKAEFDRWKQLIESRNITAD